MVDIPDIADFGLSAFFHLLQEGEKLGLAVHEQLVCLKGSFKDGYRSVNQKEGDIESAEHPAVVRVEQFDAHDSGDMIQIAGFGKVQGADLLRHDPVHADAVAEF